MGRVKHVLEEALKLPSDEREQILIELSASLNSGFGSKEIEAAWLAEVDRRWKDIETGQAVLHDWTAVREDLLAELRARG